ncbi:MAG: insulinase family protein [Hyphomicrobiales bacterium]|nr:insulinase family protein [Hyphomicrobiales bacterium]
MVQITRAVVPVVLAWAVGIAVANAAPTFADRTETFTLDNGLQVVVIPDHRAPIVTHMVWYKAGAADDPPGKSGIAHFLEHLMFKGTRDHPEGEFSDVINSVGGNENAFTTNDTTAYFQNVAKQHLELMMTFEADRMANLVLTDEAVIPERNVVLEERRSRVDNEPSSQLREAIGATLFQNSGYGTPTIGWAHEIASLDRADAVAFYDRYYTPNNAILIVAGDVTTDEVRRLAEETYGKVPRRADPPERLRPREPEPLASRTVTFADSQVTQPVIQRTFVAPSYATDPSDEAVALDLLADILGSGPTSRLYRELVAEKGVATTAGASYRSSVLGDSQFALFGIPRGDVSLDELMLEIEAVVEDVAANGVTEEELDRAKRRIMAGAVYSQDSHSSLARVFGNALVTGQTVDDVQRWPADVEAVTADRITAVARKYLQTPRSVTGYLVGVSEENPS